VIRKYRRRAKQKTKTHKTFIKTVLCAISFADERSCPLRLLEHGAETADRFKEMIAEFLDTPNGKMVNLIEQALANLVSLHLGRLDE